MRKGSWLPFAERQQPSQATASIQGDKESLPKDKK